MKLEEGRNLRKEKINQDTNYLILHIRHTYTALKLQIRTMEQHAQKVGKTLQFQGK